MFDWRELEELAGKVAGLDAGVGSDRDLFEAAVAIERVRALLDVAEGSVLAELDRRGATDVTFGLHTNAWLSRDAGISRPTATARLRVGQKLDTQLPATRAGLLEGRISWDHARVMADAANPRIVDVFAEVEADLVGMAEGMVFARWADHVRDVARLLDLDGGYDPSGDVDRNRLHLSRGLDGVSYLKGSLVGLDAEAVRQAIERVAGEIGETFRRDSAATDGAVAVPSRATLRALALVELVRRANAAGDPAKVGPSPEISLIVGAEDIDEHGHISEAHTPAGVRLQGGQLTKLGCNSSLFPVIVDSLGIPLDLGREVRLATTPQRRALAVRDGGCYFPGCDAQPDACHAHHIDEWLADLGSTDVAHMVLACPHHHGVAHRTGWHITLHPDGWTVIETPDGNRIWGQRHGQQRTGPPPAPEPPSPP